MEYLQHGRCHSPSNFMYISVLQRSIENNIKHAAQEGKPSPAKSKHVEKCTRLLRLSGNSAKLDSEMKKDDREDRKGDTGETREPGDACRMHWRMRTRAKISRRIRGMMGN